MSNATSIGLEDPHNAKQSGIDDESSERTQGEGEGESVLDDDAGHDVTREDIESGNDRNVSADDNNRAGKTNKTTDDGIQIN